MSLKTLILLLCSCSIKYVEKSPSFKVDYSLIGEESLLKYEYPFIAKFYNHNKSLIYLATSHEVTEDTKTFKLIRRTISDFTPQLVIIEGIEYCEPPPAWFIEHINSCWGKNGRKKCSEATFAAFIAQNLNIRYIGGEPTSDYIISKILKINYTPVDLLSFYLLESIPQFKKEERHLKHFKNVAAKIIAKYRKKLNLPQETFDFNSFKKWYEIRSGKKFKLNDINTRLIFPFKNGENFFQKFAFNLKKIRDEYLVRLIEEKFLFNENILVVFGGGHYVSQKKALSSLFGKDPIENEYFK